MSDNTASKFFAKFATTIADLSGKPATFVLAVMLVVVWAVSGPIFDYSENWQLVINTSTTIITFLMVFVLQNSQDRDGKALMAKLDELMLTSQAQNKFVGIEKLDEAQLREMSKTLSEKPKASKTSPTIGLRPVRPITRHPFDYDHRFEFMASLRPSDDRHVCTDIIRVTGRSHFGRSSRSRP